jgi:hypothetical protein
MPKREAFYSLFFKEYKGKRLCLLTVALDTGSAFALLRLSGMTDNKWPCRPAPFTFR